MTTALMEQLGLLGLRHTAGALDDIIALATKSRWGVQQILPRSRSIWAAVVKRTEWPAWTAAWAMF
jgi:hypothetical protein